MIQSTRRGFLATAASSAFLAQLSRRLVAEEDAAGQPVKHSACKWCYPDIPLDELCAAGREFGLQSVELLQPEDVPTVQRNGMTCAIMSNPPATGPGGRPVGGIANAWNRTENHEALVESYEKQIESCARLGISNLICFSGNRAGLDDLTGRNNCASGLKQIIPTAEKLGVTISMELLNSKVDHTDYMCDRTEWGVALCQTIDSPRFRLLYDIYHMQVMEGDVIATIRKYQSFISHYHTGGVPGRHEIDDSQELQYSAIARAIADTGYQGFIGQEFIPSRSDKLASLRQGVEICTVLS